MDFLTFLTIVIALAVPVVITIVVLNRPSIRNQKNPFDLKLFGRTILEFLLLLIPITAAVVVLYIVFFWDDSKPDSTPPFLSLILTPTPTTSPTLTPTSVPNPTSISASNSPLTSTPAPTASPIATFVPNNTKGAFDRALLGPGYRFLISSIIFVLTGIIETALWMVYGALYVNDPQYSRDPLGLPPGSVRIFLLLLIIFTLIFFALLPDTWGDNKVVVLLLGMLTTVVGFYFGSRQNAESGEGKLTTISLKLDGAFKQINANNKIIKGTLDSNFQSVLSSGTNLMGILFNNNGTPVDKSEKMSVIDKDGIVEFDYSGHNFPEGSYIFKIISSAVIVECNERITISASATSAAPPTSAAP